MTSCPNCGAPILETRFSVQTNGNKKLHHEL